MEILDELEEQGDSKMTKGVVCDTSEASCLGFACVTYCFGFFF